MAHTVSPAHVQATAAAGEPSVGTLVQSAMADMSTLIRSEVELAKAEIGKSAKKAGISVGLFAVAGVLLAFAALYFFVSVAEFLTYLGLARWLSYLIVTAGLVVVAVVAGLIGRRMLKRVEKPERTLETLRDLPEVARRETPGQRHRAVPEISNGQVKREGAESYTL